MTDIARVRFTNAQSLLEEFARSRSGIEEMRGIETQFAARLGITKNYWSALKTGKRQIGAILARQFEARCGKPSGWLDQEEARSARIMPSTDEEWLVTTLVLTAYRTHPEVTKAGIVSLLQDALGSEADTAALLPKKHKPSKT